MNNIKPVGCAEYLSKDILDEDFIKTFKHIHNIQVLLGSCRIYVKHRFVTKPTNLQKFYTVVLLIISLILDYIAAQLHLFQFKDSKRLYYLCLMSMAIEVFKHIYTIIHARFLNGEENADFFIKLQNIDRLMKINHNEVINKILYRINITAIVFLGVHFVILLTTALGKGQFIHLAFAGLAYSQYVFLVEMTHCTNIVMYFFLRIRFINSIIKNHLNPQDTFVSRRYLFTKKAIRRLASETHEFTNSDTDLYLKALFNCFFDFQQLYRFQILVFCIKHVLSCLVTFEITVAAIQSNLLDTSEIFIPVIYLSFDILIALLLSVRCESFYREIKETKRLCIGIMARYQYGPLREKARRMLSLIEEDPPCFNVYDMWIVDANIFVKIVSLVTSLVVTLLQFAFL